MKVYDEIIEVTPAMLDAALARCNWSFPGRVHVLCGELHDGSIYQWFLTEEENMSDIGVVFTGPDKALLDRSARAAEAAAKRLGWEAMVGKQRKSAKLEYDRLMRDAHDLRLMGVRLTRVAKLLKGPDLSHAARVQRVAEKSGDGIQERRAGIERRRFTTVIAGQERRGGTERRGAG